MSESDEKICEMFGITLDDVVSDEEHMESGFPGEEFGAAIDGLPAHKTRPISITFYDYEIAAIDSAAAREGISRSAWVRRACNNELVSLS